MKKYLIVIPARGESKGIRKKNIVDLCGKPLIAYTIEPALKIINKGLAEKIIISTDSEEIKNVSESLGIEVPFLRPKSISGDKAKSVDLLLHAINFFEALKIFFCATILLQPTTPLRKYEDIYKSIKLFEKGSNNSLISVYKEEYINNLVMYKKDDNKAIPLNKNHNQGIRRQEHKATYIRNGAIYITDIEYLKKTKKIISDIPLLYEMPKSRSINLDTPEDLKMLRGLLCK